MKKKTTRKKKPQHEPKRKLMNINWSAIGTILVNIWEFISNMLFGLWELLVTYHLIIITLSISGLSSFCIIYYSAEAGKHLFPTYSIGFLLMLIIEVGFVVLNYLAVAIGVHGIALFFIRLFLIPIFLLSVSPATIGVNQKISDETKVVDKAPTKSGLIKTLTDNNKTLSDQIKANTKIMTYTSSSKIFNDLKTKNDNLQSTIDDNIKTITDKETEYEKAFNEYENEKKQMESTDPQIVFIRDFFLKTLIVVVQILNFIMSILGSYKLAKIKGTGRRSKKKNELWNILYARILSFISGKNSGNINNVLPEQLKEHENQMSNIFEYTKKVKNDMEILAGEMNLPGYGAKTDVSPIPEKPIRETHKSKAGKIKNKFKNQEIVNKSSEASEPFIFKKKIKI